MEISNSYTFVNGFQENAWEVCTVFRGSFQQFSTVFKEMRVRGEHISGDPFSVLWVCVGLAELCLFGLVEASHVITSRFSPVPGCLNSSATSRIRRMSR